MSSFMKQADEAARAEATRQQGGTTQSPSSGNTTQAPAQQRTTAAPTTGHTTSAPQQTTKAAATSNNTTQATTGTTTQAVSSSAGGKVIRAAQTPAADNTTDDAALLQSLNDKFGTQFKTMDEVRAHMAGGQQPATALNTAQQQQAREKQLVDHFLSLGKNEDDGNGGKRFVPNTMDDYFRIQTTLKLPDADLVRNHHKAMMKQHNPAITDTEIEDAFNHRYFISTPDLKFEPNIVAAGEKQLKADAELIRKHTALPLTVAQQDFDTRQQEQQDIQNWQRETDQFIATELPTMLAFDFGTVQDVDLGRYEFTYGPQVRQQVTEILKDPYKKFLELFHDPATKKVDKKKLSNILLWHLAGEDMLREAARNYFGAGVDSIASTLNNEPNLGQNSGGTDAVVAEQQKVQDATKAATETGKQILGGSQRTFTKSFK